MESLVCFFFPLQSQILVCGPVEKMPEFSFRQWSHFPNLSLQSGDGEHVVVLTSEIECGYLFCVCVCVWSEFPEDETSSRTL